jgi:hypothetical protein
MSDPQKVLECDCRDPDVIVECDHHPKEPLWVVRCRTLGRGTAIVKHPHSRRRSTVTARAVAVGTASLRKENSPMPDPEKPRHDGEWVSVERWLAEWIRGRLHYHGDHHQAQMMTKLLDSPTTAALGTQEGDEGHPHLIGGEFQSDKYPTCPRGKVPLSVKDKTAQDLLWQYAQRHRAVDAEFADDLEIALTNAGYTPLATHARTIEALRAALTTIEHSSHDSCAVFAAKVLKEHPNAFDEECAAEIHRPKAAPVTASAGVEQRLREATPMFWSNGTDERQGIIVSEKARDEILSHIAALAAAELEAENARLRAALEKIMTIGWDTHCEVAHRALSGKQQP